MHPQIVRKEPGSCPICDMALEPMTPSTGDAVSPELRDMTWRLWAGVALSMPLLAMAMAEHFDKPALDALLSPHLAVWVQLILGTPAVLWGGWPFFQRGWSSIVSRRLNMFTLIAPRVVVEIAEGGRQAVAAMLQGSAAERPQSAFCKPSASATKLSPPSTT